MRCTSLLALHPLTLDGEMLLLSLSVPLNRLQLLRNMFPRVVAIICTRCIIFCSVRIDLYMVEMRLETYRNK